MTRILLLDDEPQIRELFGEVLRGAGFDVVVGGDGVVVMSEAALKDIDVVVTDIMMPTCDGLEVVRHIKSRSKQVKVIAMSGGGRTLDRDYLPVAGKFGADRTLQKPFSPFDLVDEIRALVGPCH